MKKKPGVMIYFDLRYTLDRLSDAMVGKLFRAIMEYGETGCCPQLPDKLLLLWPMIEMRLITDDFRYRENATKSRYAAYCRWSREKEIAPLCYEEWLASEYQTDAI